MNPQTPQEPNSASTTAPVTQAASAPASAAVSGKKTAAIVALVLSIIGFLTGFIFIGFALAIAGIILGIIGLVKRKPGKGLYIASVIISGLCLLSLPLTLALTITAYNGITQRANQSVIQSGQ